MTHGAPTKRGGGPGPVERNALEYTIPLFGARSTTVTQAAIPDGDAGTAVTVGMMANIIRASAAHPVVRQETLRALAGLPHGADRRQRAQALFWHLKRRIRFVDDHALVQAALGEGVYTEGLIAPERLLTMPEPRGDCDDYSMALAAMLAAAGVPVELVTIAADGARPAEFSHVYVQAVLEDGSRFPLDASHGPAPGWESPRWWRRHVWPIFGLAPRGLHGLDKAYGTPYWTDKGVRVAGLNGALDWFKAGSELTKTILTLRPPAGTSIVTEPGRTAVYRTTPEGFGPIQAIPGWPGATMPYLLIGGVGLVVLLALLAARR